LDQTDVSGTISGFDQLRLRDHLALSLPSQFHKSPSVLVRCAFEELRLYIVQCFRPCGGPPTTGATCRRRRCRMRRRPEPRFRTRQLGECQPISRPSPPQCPYPAPGQCELLIAHSECLSVRTGKTVAAEEIFTPQQLPLQIEVIAICSVTDRLMRSRLSPVRVFFDFQQAGGQFWCGRKRGFRSRFYRHVRWRESSVKESLDNANKPSISVSQHPLASP
jgi:hypothetical protein